MTEKKNIYKRDKQIILDYFNFPYPPYLHDSELYDSVDYLAGLCNSFIKRPNTNLNRHLNVFAGDVLAKIEHNIFTINCKELTEYYKKMRLTLRILHKYYNEDGIVKKKFW